ncbi:MAG: sigma-70 family RNA polymerase sigma factor [Candidatus Pedobacter colombiensis]|uniref:Sigma-70 family RNA polymerase sigma factor n=1 Tax=Candidatus Pedobacter colombiensis TaxID=3121371 RepID=A0AAJ6B5B6_9SPHI|nr:sigma-70 family RNA polymerase sigma factor [Pedobacter sp.]WEK18572.1 MAG: sigma-70 family RNA polymerase sigma factor [Pedobacter sp.]
MRQLKIAQSITNRNEDGISRYLVEIAQIDLLRQGEEAILAVKVKNGDQFALEKMIKTNLRFVVSVAKQYQNNGLSLCDLISEGNIGLIKAAKRFDPTKGFKFISFAVYWIRQCIIQAISEQKRTVKLSGNQIYDMGRVSKASIKLEQMLERTPTLTELAEVLGLSEEKIADVLYNGGISVSVEVKSNAYSELSLLDTLVNTNSICPSAQLFKESLSKDLIRAIDTLPEKQRVVLKYCYGIDNFPELTHDDIAYKIGLTAERVRQLKCKGIESLKTICQLSCMTDYFG